MTFGGCSSLVARLCCLGLSAPTAELSCFDIHLYKNNAHDLNYKEVAFARCNSIIGKLCCLGSSAQATALSSLSMPGHVLGICQPETPETTEGKHLKHAIPPHHVQCNG